MNESPKTAKPSRNFTSTFSIIDHIHNPKVNVSIQFTISNYILFYLSIYALNSANLITVSIKINMSKK